MTLITLPDPDAIRLLSLDLDVPDQLNESPFTRRSQVVGLPGAETWYLSAALEPITTEMEERPWRAFMFSMRGRQNRFHFPFCKQRHIGTRPLVGAGSNAGYTLPLTAMQPSTRILQAGQFLTVPLPSGRYRLVMLATDLITDASGNAVANLNVALTEPPIAGSVVVSDTPFLPVRNTEGRVSMSYDNAISGSSFALVEAR